MFWTGIKNISGVRPCVAGEKFVLPGYATLSRLPVTLENERLMPYLAW
jgi:hypothetical protein